MVRNPATQSLETKRAFRGRVIGFSTLPRTRDHLVTVVRGGALLHARDGSSAKAIPGERAFFSSDGQRVVTSDAKSLYVVDVSTGAVTATVPTPRPITSGVVVDKGDSFISVDEGGCAMSGGSVFIVDLAAGKVLLDHDNLAAATLSKSRRHVAAIVSKLSPKSDLEGILHVWDRKALTSKPATANIGSEWTVGPPYGVTFSTPSRSVIVFECGLAARNTFTSPIPRHRFDVARRKLRPAPPAQTLASIDRVLRWKQIEAVWKRAARPPRQLVPEMAGPTRPDAFAEDDARTMVALIEGQISPLSWGVSVKSPVVLIGDTRTKRVRHRIPLAFPATTALVNVRLEMSPNGKGMWACLGPSDQPSTMFAIDPVKGTATKVGEHACWEPWEFSDDGKTLFKEDVAIDLSTGVTWKQ